VSSLPPPENRPRVGSVLDGRYRLIGELGEGGIGWVYRAEHLALGHHVAIKMLQTQFVGHDQMRPRFEREAKALAALSHPNIVTLTDYHVSEGRPYLVMELLEGMPLSHRIDRGAMAEAEARPIIRQVLDALAYAHQRGFVHRDLKPDNVFLVSEPPDFVKVLDFGFVKLVEPTPDDDSMNAQLTRSGAVFGTPAYMSPEQIASDKIDATSDVYSLGITIFEMLAGFRPFDGENSDVLRSHLMTELPKLEVDGLEASPELARFLARATAKKRGNRFATAEEMLAAISAVPSPWMVPIGTGAYSAPATPSPSVVTTGRSASSSRGGLVAGLAALFILIAVAGVVAIAFLGRTSRTETTAQSPDSRAASVPDAGSPMMGRRTDIAALVDRLPIAGTVASTFGPSPWQSAEADPLLDAARERVTTGFALDESTERALKDYARANHDDPRPHLILGEHFFLRRYRDDAIERLNLGQRLSPRARNDPRMLAILLVLLADSETSNDAANVIANHYGAAAREAVQAELERPGVGPIAANKIRALARRLR